VACAYSAIRSAQVKSLICLYDDASCSKAEASQEHESHKYVQPFATQGQRRSRKPRTDQLVNIFVNVPAELRGVIDLLELI